MTERLAETLPAFRMAIRANIERLWSGRGSLERFLRDMVADIERELTNAWYEGAAEMGVAAEELSSIEKRALAIAINEQVIHVTDFGAYIVEHSKKNKGQLTPLLFRGDMWINAYNRVQNQARILAGADRKLMWVRGPTRDSCRDCLRYDGRVYRASTWSGHGISTQNPRLACHGYNCLCQLIPTDAPLNKGRPPGMTG